MRSFSGCDSEIGRAAAVAVTALAALLAGCGDNKKDKPATQTAARVNEEEITVHQINYMLQQQRALPPEHQLTLIADLVGEWSELGADPAMLDLLRQVTNL